MVDALLLGLFQELRCKNEYAPFACAVLLLSLVGCNNNNNHCACARHLILSTFMLLEQTHCQLWRSLVIYRFWNTEQQTTIFFRFDPGSGRFRMELPGEKSILHVSTRDFLLPGHPVHRVSSFFYHREIFHGKLHILVRIGGSIERQTLKVSARFFNLCFIHSFGKNQKLRLSYRDISSNGFKFV